MVRALIALFCLLPGYVAAQNSISDAVDQGLNDVKNDVKSAFCSDGQIGSDCMCSPAKCSALEYCDKSKSTMGTVSVGLAGECRSIMELWWMILIVVVVGVIVLAGCVSCIVKRR